MIGAHTVTTTDEAGVSVDLSCLVDEATVRHGREDTDSQPEASSITLEVSVDQDHPVHVHDGRVVVLADLAAALEVGGPITATTTLAGAHVRFAGTITDLDLEWTDAGEDTPQALVGQVIATGALADLGRRPVGDAPWPQQLDGARVAAVMAAAGIALDPLYSDPGTVQILARDVDSQPALDVAQGTAESAGGLVWATRDGEVRYADANHRRGTTPALALDACDILVTPRWRRTTEGLVNKVSIGYGPTPDGGEQPRYTAQRDDSIAQYDEYGFTTATELAALSDATAMGQLLLTRNRVPVWVMSNLPVDVEGLDQADTATLLGLDMHDLLSLTGLPAAGSAPTSAYLWVEGATERLAWAVHEFELVVSGYCRTSPPPRWNDVDPAWTWDTVTPPTTTWDDATCFGPQPSHGRWDDQPASARWNTQPPSLTWDTWT